MPVLSASEHSWDLYEAKDSAPLSHGRRAKVPSWPFAMERASTVSLGSLDKAAVVSTLLWGGYTGTLAWPVTVSEGSKLWKRGQQERAGSVGAVGPPVFCLM